MKRSGLLAALAVVMAVVGTGCQPPPPRLSLTVTTTVNGFDDLLGDGLCTSVDAGGECTLQAAVAEGNLAPDGADISVPAGVYNPGNLVITGDIAVNPGSIQDVILTSAITVEESARFAATGIGPTTGPNFRLLAFDVAGRLDLVQSTLTSFSRTTTGTGLRPALTVSATGTVLMADSLVLAFSPVSNAGRLAAVRSTVAQGLESPAPVLDTTAGGTTYLLASSLQRTQYSTATDPVCAGNPPVSLGYVHLDVPCGGPPASGDTTGPSGVDPYQFAGTWFDPTSPLIDAVPAGTNACKLPLVDLDGIGRGNDGDGDGTGACDVGAFELQPAV
jgi:hypothetical protein